MRYLSVFTPVTLFLLVSCMAVAPVQPTAIQLHDADGAVHSLMQSHGVNAIVFIFVGVDCPVSNGYAPEINQIISDYSTRKIDFYLVYADPALTPAQVKNHSNAFKFTCPSLLDPQHQLVHRLHATVTPEVAVIADNASMLYHGRIDNRYLELGRKRFAATTNDLRDALDAIVNHQPVRVPETRAVGCEI